MVVKTGMVNAFIVNNLLKCVCVCGKVTTHITLGRKFVVIGVLFYQLTCKKLCKGILFYRLQIIIGIYVALEKDGFLQLCIKS